MNTTRNIRSAESAMVPTGRAGITLDDRLLIMDTLCSPVPGSDINGLGQSFPLKLTSSFLLIVVEGRVKFNVNFREFVATDNSCVFINEGTIVEDVAYDDNSRVMLLCFSPKNLPVASTLHQRNVYRLYALQVVLVRLKDKHIDMLKHVYGMLRDILLDPDFEINRGDSAANCINLMASIIEQGSSSQPQLEVKTSRKDEIVAQFLKCVNEHYRERRDLGFYADRLCLSLKYMSHVVYEQTGRHPSQWIKDYVILDAKTMLRSGRYTVQQVAGELHFPNQSFFGKYFKEAVGVSPKKWK